MNNIDAANIAKEITKSIVEKSSFALSNNSYKEGANAVAEIYKIIYAAVVKPQ